MAYGAGQDLARVGCRTRRFRAPVASSVWHVMPTRLELDLQSSCGVVQNMAHSVAAKIRDRRSEFRMASLPKKVFISYVQEDGAVAYEIAAGLETQGYSSWYYERDCPRARITSKNPQSHFRLRGDGNRNFAAIVAVRSDHA